MTKKLRVMFNSNASWSISGYGQQVAQIQPRIAKLGYPLASIDFYGLEGGIIEMDGVTHYPKMSKPYGDDAMINHSRHFKPDVLFTLQDIWVLDGGVFPALAQQGVRVIPIVPIDHEPAPIPIIERLRQCYRVVSYSPFGYRELKRNGIHSTYIPHTVDTSMFKKGDGAEIRRSMGIPEDIFLFGMVAANKDNPPRKGFQHAMDAFAAFSEKHPNSGLYFHTILNHEGGFPIRNYAKHLGIADKIWSVNFYDHMYNIKQEDMHKIYSMMDVYLMPSQNEGFGVPLIEAQACEVPVIATDFTAMKDLVKDGETGYKLNVLEKYYSPLGSYVAKPDAKHLSELMFKMYEDTDREKMGKAGRQFVLDNFEIEKVFEQNWAPYLDRLEKEIYPE